MSNAEDRPDATRSQVLVDSYYSDAGARTLMQYHWQTVLNYMPPDVIMSMIKNTGFKSVACKSYIDLFHHYTGRNPL
jgi:hypothetical protein